MLVGDTRAHARGRAATRSTALGVILALLASFAVVVTSVLTAPAARADTLPTNGQPATVSADVLPTWQIDGVVYAQVTVGNTVYATGQFTYARPPGTAVGDPSQVARGNLLAYDITTGVITSFNHTLNGIGRALAVSPDGSRVYVAGAFTAVDGSAHYRVAAFDTASGALVDAFAPSVNNQVRAIAATNTAVYVGGDFTAANGLTANHLAAFDPATGASLSWSGGANDSITAMVMAPDQSRVVVAGRFTTLDSGSFYGIGALDATTGATTPWSSAFPIKDAGANSAITDLIANGNLVYGTAYDFGSGGNFEGRFAADPYTGNLQWLDSCHGDSYSLAILGQVIYSASHAHDCSDGSSFDQMSSFARAQAETIYSTGIAAHNNDTGNANYHDFGGQVTNSLLPWSPKFDPGTFTNEDQASWSVVATSQYVAYGGEFPNVNGIPQQGLVRFAIPSIAPNKTKPLSRSNNTPTAVSVYAGTALVDWVGTYDMDNANLTYQLYRDGGSTPIYTTTAVSDFYQQPQLSYLDTGLVPGTTHTYTVKVSDPYGNAFTTFASQPVTIVGSGSRSAYETAVTGDGATDFWPLSESSGTGVSDHIGANDMSVVSISDVTRGVTGPAAAGSAKATAFDGTSSGSAAAVNGSLPRTDVSVEAWVKTATGGGVIVDYGMTGSHVSAIMTDALYLNDAGQLYFALWTNTGYRSINTSATLTDNKWHHVVGTLSSSNGAALYVDGAQAASDPTITTTRQFLGYWRVAGDRPAYLPSAPTNGFVNGAIADVAVYPTALTAAQIAAHTSGTGTVNTAPSAAIASPSCSALACNFDGTGSSDSNGSVANWAWNFGDTTTGTGPAPSHTYSTPGTYTVTLTVTDNAGLTSTTSTSVTVHANQPPTAAFTVSCTNYTCSYDATASSDPDGPIASYTWDFGDGNTANGATTTHTYTVAGDYPVTLTVADTGTPALTNSVVHTASPVPPANVTTLASDAFNRTVSGGWGSADVGGAWTTTTSASNESVTPGTGTLVNPTAPSSNLMKLAAVSATDSDTTAVVSIDKVPTGSGMFVSVLGRRVNSTNEYRGRLRVNANGSLTAALTKFGGSSTETAVVADTAVPGITYTPGMKLDLRLQVVGTNPTTLRFKVWQDGTTEPGWLITATDSTATIQTAGAVGLYTFSFSSATNAPQTISVYKFVSTPSQGAPVAVPNVTCTQLVCSADASASTGSGALTYAWSFGDGATATGVSASHTYADGGSYRVTLTVTDAAGQTGVGRQSITLNRPPVATFTPTCTSGLSCSFDGSAASDPDGTIVSTSWDFGDGTGATTATASHTYSTGGTYTVRYTVTDDGGASTTSSQTVTVPPPNKPPVPSFTVSCSVLTCSVDGTASSDPDGTVAGWSFDFGDGTAPLTSATGSHTYTYAGDYPVTLTVTDNQGATSQLVQTATVTAAPNPAIQARDTFNRTVTGGWGTADLGGAWTATNSATNLSVKPGAGLIKLNKGNNAGARLTSIATTSSDLTATVAYDKMPTSNTKNYAFFDGRRVGNVYYRARLKFISNGQLLAALFSINGTTQTPIGTEITVPLRYSASMQLNVHFQVDGTNPTTLHFSVWKAGTTEPAWQLSATDNTAGLQAAGYPQIAANIPSTATNSPVTLSVLAFQLGVTNQPPVAAFTPTCSAATCSVDASASTDDRGIASYTWVWGDGTTTTGVTSNHTYAATGSYRITLTVTDTDGFVTTTQQTVSAELPPVASFTTTGSCPDPSLTTNTCTFDASASVDPGGPITGYSWDFGDGFNGTGKTISHTFAAATTYTVTLTVTGHDGLTASVTHQYTFSKGNQPPVAAYVVTCTGLTCQFDGSTSSDPDGTITAYSWNFGDGTTDTGQTATHTYAAASRVTTSLTVTDNGNPGLTNTAYYVVQTRPPNTPPVAQFTASCTSALTCNFDGSSSYDPDGTVAAWTWNFGDGTTGAGPTVSHTYSGTGPYTVTLQVQDNDSATTSTSQSVTPTNNQPPTAAFTLTCTALTCSFDGSGSSDQDGTVASYAWDFGDGQTGTGATASHTYANPGTYTAKLTVTDNIGATGSVTHSATATAPNAPPVPSFTTSCNGLACSVDGSATTDPNGSISSYAWTFGDGQAASGATATNTYASAGTYPITLTATDSGGASASLTRSVTIVAGDRTPTAAFTPSCPSLTCTLNAGASSDPDGTVASYAWNFGDGTTGTGSAPSHPFPTAGDYTVTLTVTDNQGATNTVSQVISPRPAPNATSIAADSFNRTVTGGWGTADSGGSWTATNGTTGLSVTQGVGGQFVLGSVPLTLGAQLRSVSTSDADVTESFSVDKPTTGGGAWVYVTGRRAGSNIEYRARVKVLPNGQVAAVLLMLNGTTTTLLGSEITVPGLVYTTGTQLKVRMQATGTSPTTLRMKVWQASDPEPSAWLLSTTDSTAGFQTAGSVGTLAYLPASVTNAPITVTVTSFVVNRANQPPTASVTSSCSGLTCAMDGTGSADPEGGTLTYSWNFGDGVSALNASATPSHTWATAGTYRVTLTVTDPVGFTAVATRTVVVPQ